MTHPTKKINVLKLLIVSLAIITLVVNTSFSFAADSPNLINNPSVEDVNSVNKILPQSLAVPTGWNKNHNVFNTANFSFPVSGYNSQKAIKIQVLKYKQNEEGWYFNKVKITPGAQYNFSDYFIADTKSYITATFTLLNGSTSKIKIAQAQPAAQWTQTQTSFTSPTNATAVTITHSLRSIGSLTTDVYSLSIVNNLPTDTTPPIITLNGESKISIIVGSIYTDAGATAIDNVDGNITSKIITVNPVDTSKIGTYMVTYNVSDSSGNKAVQITREVNIIASQPDTTPPIISIQDPLAGTTLSHSIIIKSATSDPGALGEISSGINQVQFYVDGSPFGNPILSAPYQTVLDTTQFPDGSHILGAMATDNQQNTSLISTVSINIYNAPITSPNLISNPSLEDGSDAPTDWLNSSWGTNNTTFNYPITGHTGNGASATITNYISGDAKWYFKDINILPGVQYTFSDFYKSDISTFIVARYTLSDKSILYAPLGATTASPDWVQFSNSFVTPDNAISVTIFHLIQANGSLSTDDFSLSQASSLPFNQGMISINFDDGVPSFYTNGLPILTSHGMKSTDYIISGELGNSDSITVSQMLHLQSLGHEIGSHTKTHPDLTTLTQSQIIDEIINSKKDLESLGVNTITTLAYPFGTWNNLTDQIVKQSGYLGARTALAQDGGANYRDGNPFLIRTESVESTTTLNQVEQWINQAIQNKTWLILVFHGVDNTGNQYSITPTKLTNIANYISTNQIKTITNAEGIYLMTHK